ncbi:Co2+/Mg2+ efflux protein ApaG [Myxococcota bacterium]|nr:Co2+/Mg2+ efflux protein ApaG [Myxococcota bacterium]
MSDTTTQGIRVQVEVKFLPEQSEQDRSQWLFAYTITISNVGKKPAKLLNRHWIITDGWGQVQEVKGPGVVGEQPRLLPGEAFRYTSYCPLSTPTGSMQGTYEMIDDEGRSFDADIGEFMLFDPSTMN